MSFSGKVKILKNLNGFKNFSKSIERAMEQANGMAANEIRNEAVQLLAENGDGPIQIRYNPKRKVHVSQPGNPPNSDTGRLMQSVKYEKDGQAYLVGTNVRYGAYLEFGTKDIAPRPWLSVAVKRVTKLIPQFYRTAYDNVIKSVLK